MKKVKIALAGNPNSGKTTVFNYLTGARQHVGNWGGVTVDIKEGSIKYNNMLVKIVDLPGTYSLCAFSMEECVACNYIIEEKPDVIVHVIDATNLERNMYLAVQLMEMGVKPILVFNMWDEVEANGYEIDITILEKLLDVTIVPTVGKSGKGLKCIIEKSVQQVLHKQSFYSKLLVTYPRELEEEIDKLAESDAVNTMTRYSPKWLAVKLFENDAHIETLVLKQKSGERAISMRDEAADRIRRMLGEDPETIIAESRYGYIAGALKEVVSVKKKNRKEISEKIDTVLTHRFWAYPVFLVFMWILFQVTFTLGAYPMGWIEAGIGWVSNFIDGHMADSAFKDLIIDGVIGGVGGVVIFLPNIMILFLGISIMEDSGYMARAAFIMDKFMHKIGLHGKSFIPMIMGLGCSVPAIMAARTLESEKDRVKTILLTPLVSCSARLPVFVLFAGALFPKHAGTVVFLFQLIFGFAAFFFMGFVFKKVLFRNEEDYPFVMELPPYRLPTVRSVLIHMWEKGKHYLKKMGGVVLLFSIILWFGGAYPKAPHIEAKYDSKISEVSGNEDLSQQAKEAAIQEIEVGKVSEVMSQTYIGRIGTFFEPVVKPFGTDWRGAVSLITGFVAKEVVVGSMGVLYAVGEEEDEESASLREKLREQFTPLSAFAFMFFVLLYTPCIVALVTAVRELRNWKWSVFSLAYQLSFAWIVAVSVYQIGKLFV